MRLPFLKGAAPSERDLARKLGPGGPAQFTPTPGSTTILLVSRDADTRILVRSLFLIRGHLVLEATSEAHAMEVCRLMKGEVDLIIADASLFQPQSRLRWRQRVPGLLMLLDALDSHVDSGESDSGVGYLRRPFTADEIVHKVRSILDAVAPRKKILIVDDDEVARGMFADVLEATGYEVVQAASGIEAITGVDALRMDLILTEIVMPEMEGLQMVHELLQMNPELRIIAMSGGERAGLYLSLARSLGVRAGIVKPFTDEELLRVVYSVLQG